MGAPKGNQYGAKGREVSRALWRALAANKYERLHQGAEKVADAFAAGEPWAVHFVADRLEGKAMPMMPETDGRAFSITWSFGAEPQTLDHVPRETTLQPLDIPQVSSAQPGDDGPAG